MMLGKLKESTFYFPLKLGICEYAKEMNVYGLIY